MIKAILKLQFLLIICATLYPKLSFAMSCNQFFDGSTVEQRVKGVEVSTFRKVGEDLTALVGNDAIRRSLMALTARPGLRLQVANIVGAVGRGQVFLSRVIEAGADGLIDMRALQGAIAESSHQAEMSGAPILNTSLLISRDGKPQISPEDRHYADQIYERIFEQIMIEHRLTRQQLQGMQSGLRGKVWYFVAQTHSSPENVVVIYDPSNK